MANIDMQFHGSDIEKVEAVFNIKKEDIINFSGNVNPLGLSDVVTSKLKDHIQLIAAYPDREYTTLRETIADYVGVHPRQVLVGNGSTELISLFIKVINPKAATIIGPTYSEYEREIRINGGKSTYYALHETNKFEIELDPLFQEISKGTDLLILCNPNNPTSTSVKHPELRKILDYCLAHHIDVLIDETYVEFAEDYENITGTQLTETYHNLFIIRGVSKFFAAPGLRLGYGITANKDLIRSINRLKNPWAINSLAAYAGELMLKDQAYIEASKQLINQERTRLVEILSGIEALKVFEPIANFILIRFTGDSHNATDLFRYLIKRKIMIRDASGFPFLDKRYFRFCIGTVDNNNLLIEAISDYIREH